MIWFTSDTHFNCEGLVKETRPQFVDCKQHDEHLLDQINSHVDRNDTLVILGDFAYKKPGRWRPQIRCRHTFFILGNHDNERKTRAVFGGNVWQQKMIKVGDKRVWCCHYPTAYWDRCHYGTYHAYGHVHHNAVYEACMSLGLPGRRSMDVGVDHAKSYLGDYRPWIADEFFWYLKDCPGHNIIERKRS